MSHTSQHFERRLSRIVRSHDRMARGTSYKVNQSGLIIARPRLLRPQFPVQGIVTLVASVLAFKGFLYAYLGSGIYQSRVEQLADGIMVEKIGAWFLQVEPATLGIANILTKLGV